MTSNSRSANVPKLKRDMISDIKGCVPPSGAGTDSKEIKYYVVFDINVDYSRVAVYNLALEDTHVLVND